MVLFDCASNYYFLLWLCEALLLLVNASCLSTMTSDVAMSHGNVTPLTLPDCAFGFSQRSLIVWSYIGVILFLFWFAHSDGADEFEI